jgi:outer membrane protein assembly factor BamB
VVSDQGRTTVYSPMVVGPMVVAGFTEFSLPGTGGVVAMAADTGRVLWKRYYPPPDDPTLATNFAGGPVIHNDEVLASSGDGVIYAFERMSGEIKWALPRLTSTTRAVASPDRDYRPLTVANGTLVAGSLTGVVTGFDLATRQEKWRFHDVWVGSTAFRNRSAEGVAYIPYLSGMVIALDAKSGTELWRMGEWFAGLIWPPAFSGDRVIMSGSGYGYVAVPHVLPR